MKLAIPTDGEKLTDYIASHFGRARNYIIYDTENDEVSILPNTSEHQGGSGLPPELLKKEKVDVLLCGSLGRKALMRLKELNIAVYCGSSNTVKEIITDYKSGKLQKADMNSTCQKDF